MRCWPQLLLVNSMHTVLALMTLEDYREANRGLTLEDLLGEPDGTRRDDITLCQRGSRKPVVGLL
jgi:hypothetical protein